MPILQAWDCIILQQAASFIVESGFNYELCTVLMLVLESNWLHKAYILRNMESGPTHSVRVVRCPRCRMLLPEPPNIPVYKCGGCGTVLQGNYLRDYSVRNYGISFLSCEIRNSKLLRSVLRIIWFSNLSVYSKIFLYLTEIKDVITLVRLT